MLLRLESWRRDEVRDPHRSYACMRARGRGWHSAAAAPCRCRGGGGHHGFRAASAHERLFAGAGRTWPATSAIWSHGCRRYRCSRRSPTIRRWSDGLLGLLLASGRFAPGLLDRHRRRRLSVFARPIRWDGEALVSSDNDLESREHPVRRRAPVARSTGRRPIATIPWSMWRRSRYSLPLRRNWRRCCSDPGLAGSRIAPSAPASS